MKIYISKHFLYLGLIIFIIITVVGVIGLSTNEKREPVVLCGLTEQDEQADVAFNYVSKKTFISSDGYMAIQTPNGWRSQSVNHDGLTTEVLCSNDGASHIQLCSFKLTNDNDISPDSIIERLEFENEPGGKVDFSKISENSVTVNTVKGKTMEISGSDNSSRHIHGLVTVLIDHNRCYIISCISTETNYPLMKDLFLSVKESLILQ